LKKAAALKTVFLIACITHWAVLFSQDTLHADSSSKKPRPFIDFLTKRRNFLVAPQLDRSPETGFLTGIYYLQLLRPFKDSLTRTSNTETFLSVTEKHQYIFEFNETILFRHDKFILRGSSILSSYNEYFYGIGNDIDVRRRELINLNFYQNTQRLTRVFHKKFYAGLQYQFYKTWDIRESSDSLLSRSTALGKSGSITSGAGPVLLYDSRDNVIYSSKGLYVDVSALFAQRSLGSEYSYTNFTVDVRKFKKFYRNNIIAFQGLLNFNWGQVPFRQLALMGSDILMRGYYMGTYRDKIMLCGQTELRLPVYKFIGIILFTAVGEVQQKVEQLNIDDIRVTYGFGLRLMLIKHEKVNVGGELGFSRNTKALYLGSGESF
jgi:hypothetical protein